MVKLSNYNKASVQPGSEPRYSSPPTKDLRCCANQEWQCMHQGFVTVNCFVRISEQFA